MSNTWPQSYQVFQKNNYGEVKTFSSFKLMVKKIRLRMKCGDPAYLRVLNYLCLYIPVRIWYPKNKH